MTFKKEKYPFDRLSRDAIILVRLVRLISSHRPIIRENEQGALLTGCHLYDAKQK